MPYRLWILFIMKEILRLPTELIDFNGDENFNVASYSKRCFLDGWVIFRFICQKNMLKLFYQIYLRPFKSPLQSSQQTRIGGFYFAVDLRMLHLCEMVLDFKILKMVSSCFYMWTRYRCSWWKTLGSHIFLEHSSWIISKY